MDAPDKIAQLVGALPFMLYIKGKGPHVNSIRLIEVLLSSALTLGIVYGIVTTEVKGMKEELTGIKQEMRELRKDFYEPRTLRVPR